MTQKILYMKVFFLDHFRLNHKKNLVTLLVTCFTRNYNTSEAVIEHSLELLASCQKLIKIADHSKSTRKVASSSVAKARLVFSVY